MMRIHRFWPVLALAWACDRPAEREPEPYTGEMEPLAMHCDLPAPPAGVPTVQVVFSCDEQPVGAWRELPEGVLDTLVFALEALLAGPTHEEVNAGLDSFFSSATEGSLAAARVSGGVAYIDLHDLAGIIPNASSSAGSSQLLDQLAGTIFQFDSIREAEITVAGDCDAFWNWLQRGCQRLSRDEP
jgi:hypothetical protein